MKRADLLTEVTTFITDQWDDKEDIDLNDAGSDIQAHLEALDQAEVDEAEPDGE